VCVPSAEIIRAYRRVDRRASALARLNKSKAVAMACGDPSCGVDELMRRRIHAVMDF
jgi:hypothetical protein